MITSVRKSVIARTRSKRNVLTQWEVRSMTDIHQAPKSPRQANKNEKKNDKDHAETMYIMIIVIMLETLVFEGQKIRL